jgi:sulfocyanin
MRNALLIRSGLLVVIPAIVAVAGCSKGDTTPIADSAGGATATPAPADSSAHDSMSHGAAPAAPAAAPGSSGAPKIDPKNVAAALEWDAATKTAKLPMVSGVGNVNGGWNFDGHANGTQIFTVPVGAKVEMPYYNDDIVPHSLGVVNGSPTNVPSAPSAPAFPGAITIKFEQGLMTGEKDLVQFTASKAGTYLIVCGVPGHAASGMWVVLVVSASAKAASVRTTG